MTEFDDFLQKTERILEARRAAENPVVKPVTNGKPSRKEPKDLLRLSSLEWSRLLLSVTDQTSGKTINRERFIAYGRTGVMLGKFVLVLKPGGDGRGTRPTYFAEYRASSPDGGVIKLAEVSIEPEISKHSLGKQEIAWQTTGLDHSNQLGTAELATVLAMKLVDVYQANQGLQQATP